MVKFFISEYFWINTCFVNLSKIYRFWWQGWRKDIFLSRSGPYIQIYKKFKSLKNGLFIKMIFSRLFAYWTSNYIVYYSWPISHRLIARLTHHHMTTTFINHTWLQIKAYFAYLSIIIFCWLSLLCIWNIITILFIFMLLFPLFWIIFDTLRDRALIIYTFITIFI